MGPMDQERIPQRARGAAKEAASRRFANLDKALRLLRERQGFSQTELAAALGVAVSTVSSWERGARVPFAGGPRRARRSARPRPR